MSTQDRVPSFLYGTAWKEDRTESLVYEALCAGFRAIDTANQRRHYFEEGAGLGIRRYLEKGLATRKDLFIQTKFTFARGQDHRKPYDETAPYAEQVKASFQSSLEHLGVDFIDSYVLHGPYSGEGITGEDWEVWSAMEGLCREGKAKALGISNVSASQLEELYESAKVKPSFVQNRCYATQRWDGDVREFCEDNAIRYQGFSLLTANPRVLQHPVLHSYAKKYGKTVPEIVFRFCIEIGILPITGTSNPIHMRQDLSALDFDLDPGETTSIEVLF